MADNTNRTNGNNQTQQQQPDHRVRGPTSALSSFLREHGIHVENRSRRERREQARRQQEQNQIEAPATPQPDTEQPASPSLDGAAAESRPATTAILYTPATTRRRTRSQANSEIVKAAQKRKKKDSSDDEDSEADSFIPGPSRKVTGRRPRVCVVFCSRCNGRFSRPVSEESDSTGEYVCPACQKGTAAGPSKPPRKRAAPKRGKGPTFGSGTAMTLSLQDLCIEVIAKHIEDVEALGDVSFINMDKIAQIICRNRKLNNHTARLFMEPHVDDMSLYDCTNVDESGLTNIAQFCSQLRRLKLVYCGRMADAVLKEYTKRLSQLTSLELFGAYLVTEDAWVDFFKTRGSQLDTFSLSHSARFTKSCLESLVDHCPQLRHLRLLSLTKLDPDWLDTLCRLVHLETLEIKFDPEGEFDLSDSIVRLLGHTGKNLKELSLRECKGLTDDVLVKGILASCPRLETLRLTHCNDMTPEGFQTLFKEWKTSKPGHGLKHLDLHRCSGVDDAALQYIIQHSFNSLKHLNLHSMHSLSETGLDGLCACKELVHLDCGFVRSTDDVMLEKLIRACPKLEIIKAFGCYQVTEALTLRPGLRLEGLERPFALA